MNPHLYSQLSKLEIEFEVMEKNVQSSTHVHVHVCKKDNFWGKGN